MTLAILTLVIGLGGLWRWTAPDNSRTLRLIRLDGHQVALLADFNHDPLLVNFWAASYNHKVSKSWPIAVSYDPPTRVLDFQQRFSIPYMIAPPTGTSPCDTRGNWIS